LSEPAYQTVPVTCPSCNNRFVSPVLAVVDAGQNPEAKALFLAGRINVAVCPQCGNAGLLNTPLVYHDPEQELLLTYVPSELGLPEAEQQRLIGDLTNRVMSSLPTEQRKGYLLRPRSFLRLESLIEAIYEADGVTPEMLNAQRARALLLDRLIRTNDQDMRRTIANENDGQIDYEFFQILALNIEVAEANGNAQAAHQLLDLRRQLLEWTATGHELSARESAIRELGAEPSREKLLDKLVEAALADELAKVETMVAIARPAIDYLFFQQLTGRIDAAQHSGKAAEVATLTALRTTILDLVSEIDVEMQQASEQAAQLLRKILQSEDLEQAVRANMARIDELFLNVLAANIQAAEQSGRSEDVEKLRRVGDTIVGLIEESQPPEIQMINQLLSAEYPEGTRHLLEENQLLLGADLLEMMRMLGQDLAQGGRKEIAHRLDLIREQAAEMVK
jgi:hypothetical protein